uniref:Uncharacterized protein n=1 Tax=Porodaedalea pini TaxID=108901 RepID=A0A5B9RJI5_9AGAM|nr:hypothetical protein PPIT_000056 [Porodaedalea pini]QEG56937.1 hypothetical protein PPIT_000056 [Porodaedalea pini]
MGLPSPRRLSPVTKPPTTPELDPSAKSSTLDPSANSPPPSIRSISPILTRSWAVDLGSESGRFLPLPILPLTVSHKDRYSLALVAAGWGNWPKPPSLSPFFLLVKNLQIFLTTVLGAETIFFCYFIDGSKCGWHKSKSLNWIIVSKISEVK